MPAATALSQLLGQGSFDLPHPHQRRILVDRDAHGAGLLRERLEHALTDPPDGVADELDVVGRIELPHRLQQPLVADRHQFRQVEAVTLEPLDVGDDEPEVGGDQPLGGFGVALAGPVRQAPFFLGIGDEREFPDVEEILIEGAPCGTPIPRPRRLAGVCHTTSLQLK